MPHVTVGSENTGLVDKTTAGHVWQRLEEHMTAPPVPVVFIHGLWIHSDAWEPWVELYRSAGYNAMAPGWPGDSPEHQRRGSR